MNFSIEDANIIPFDLHDSPVHEGFINFLVKDNDAPLDVAFKATIKNIVKKYYPVRCYDIVYSVEWDATSIWEHNESYTEYENKIVYVDYRGIEHDNPGYDNFRNGSYMGNSSYGGQGKRPWKSIQKTVPVKRDRTVVDNVQQTYGSIDRKSIVQPVIIMENQSEITFGQWIKSFSRRESFIYNKQLLDNCEIMPLYGTDEQAEKIALNEMEKNAIRNCKRQVPGNRYENLHLHDIMYDFNMNIYLYPVYHVVYEYNGINYECWLSGNDSADAFSYKKPQDGNIMIKYKELDEAIKSEKFYRNIFLYSGFFFIPVFIGLSLCLLIASLLADNVSILTAIGLFALGIVHIKLISYFNKRIKKAEGTKENYAEKLHEIRNKIVDISKDSNIDTSEKQKRIQELVNIIS